MSHSDDIRRCIRDLEVLNTFKEPSLPIQNAIRHLRFALSTAERMEEGAVLVCGLSANPIILGTAR